MEFKNIIFQLNNSGNLVSPFCHGIAMVSTKHSKLHDSKPEIFPRSPRLR